jgi:hypothetical protein
MAAALVGPGKSSATVSGQRQVCLLERSRGRRNTAGTGAALSGSHLCPAAPPAAPQKGPRDGRGGAGRGGEAASAHAQSAAPRPPPPPPGPAPTSSKAGIASHREPRARDGGCRGPSQLQGSLRPVTRAGRAEQEPRGHTVCTEQEAPQQRGSPGCLQTQRGHRKPMGALLESPGSEQVQTARAPRLAMTLLALGSANVLGHPPADHPLLRWGLALQPRLPATHAPPSCAPQVLDHRRGPRATVKSTFPPWVCSGRHPDVTKCEHGVRQPL